jgi:protein CpxP
MKRVAAACLSEGILAMSLHKMTTPALLLAAAFIGGTPLLSEPSAMAQTAQSDLPRERHFGSHIEGHIAFLKAELHITPDQEALWSKVAEVMRADVADFDQFRQRHPTETATKPTALQHLEERAAYTALRAKGEQRFLEAFRPLYAQLSDTQKRAADELLGNRREEL